MENRLRWFKHIQQRPVSTPIKKSYLVNIEGSVRRLGAAKLTLNENSEKSHDKLWFNSRYCAR